MIYLVLRGFTARDNTSYKSKENELHYNSRKVYIRYKQQYTSNIKWKDQIVFDESMNMPPTTHHHPTPPHHYPTRSHQQQNLTNKGDTKYPK